MKGTISGFEPHNQFNPDKIVLSEIAFDVPGSANLLAGNVLEVTRRSASAAAIMPSGLSCPQAW